ncbi:MAG: AAA family ATPase, partial [Prevotella sp.]|nr:AAA family ATPase [Prevotella sp.]
MAFYLEKAIFVNRAPFEHLELDFKEKGINVLSAINGKGKTTILSYIVDAFHELAKMGFENSYKGIDDQLYRVSSSNFDMRGQTYSLALLKFTNEDKVIDYVDIRGNISEEQYNDLPISHENIPYQTIIQNVNNQRFCRIISQEVNKKVSEDIFNNTILTYFPAYRYEQPGYLNKPYEVKLKFDINVRYSGYLKNPIEVITSLPEIANWLLDVVLDEKMISGNQKANELDRSINSIVKNILSSKLGNDIHFG